MSLKQASVLPIHAVDDQIYRTWVISPGGVHRDSGTIERSNHAVITDRYLEIDPEGADHAVLSFGHWAVGWIHEVIVRPGSACEREAIEFQRHLADYALLNEDAWAALEANEEDGGDDE